MANQIAFLYWTAPSNEAAQALVSELISKKLIGCANILPGVSMYTWQGAVENGAEIFVLCKTTPERLHAAIDFVEEHHEYDVPCITSWLAQGTPKYAAWLASTVE